MRIAGSAAVVTGAASGLGLATATALATAGAQVLLVDLPGRGGEEAAAGLGARFAAADVSSGEELTAALAQAMEAFGGLQIAVSCAGVAPAGRILNRAGEPLALERFAAAVQVNLVGSFNLLRLAAACMAQGPVLDGGSGSGSALGSGSGSAPADGNGERGVIVLTASVAAYEGQVGQIAYAASKGGVVGMTLPAARDLAGVGIRVMTIAPGTFDTPMLAGLREETRQALAQQVPHPRRLGRPEEFAALVGHIVANPMLNGEVIRLDGALRMPPR